MSFQPSPGSSPGRMFGTLLMLLIGAALLLPGLCSVGFMIGTLSDQYLQSALALLVALWAICFAISFGGVMLIRAAIRRGRAARTQP